jgi:transposase
VKLIREPGGFAEMLDSTAKDIRPKQGRRVYPREFKQQVIKQTLEPGASVSIVARRHDMNANVIFEWRKLYREGKLVLPASNEAPTPNVGAAQLLAVDVIDMPMATPRALSGTASAPLEAAHSVSAPPPVCEIEVEIGKRLVRIRGLPAERAEMFLQECLK